MKILYKGKDGGKNSTVTGYWLVEIKSLFSIVLLKFDDGTREAFHTHAFTALTWFLKGNLWEERIKLGDGIDGEHNKYKRSVLPKLTKKDNLHRVKSKGTSWALSIRGPWTKTWQEYWPETNELVTFTSGRIIVKKDNIK